MSRPIGAPRGTRDLLPEETPAWTWLEGLARQLSERYAFDRIETPLFERIELFARGLGETSDAVEKEMFRVSGAAGSSEAAAAWALRPEPTAGIVRAFIEHGMHVRPGPQRVWMIGPMFRYDRPQAGRFRQFSQWDVEVLGDAGPLVDAELVELAQRFFAEAGLGGVVAHLNSIGDATCRPRFRQALIDHFAPHRDRLSDDSRRRLAVNPLRVLDDKQLAADLAAAAPKPIDFLCDPCREHFTVVRDLLDRLGVRYVLDHRLVRGVDYYTRTTFELYVVGREGQQQALGGGGRYDGLVEQLSGRPTPGIGFGIGLDRTILAIGTQRPPAGPERGLVAVVGEEPATLTSRLQIATDLRAAGVRALPDGSERSLGRQLEAAAKRGARWAVIIGPVGEGRVVVRDLERGEQRAVTSAELPAIMATMGSDLARGEG